jgi:hypothetical protein
MFAGVVEPTEKLPRTLVFPVVLIVATWRLPVPVALAKVSPVKDEIPDTPRLLCKTAVPVTYKFVELTFASCVLPVTSRVEEARTGPLVERLASVDVAVTVAEPTTCSELLGAAVFIPTALAVDVVYIVEPACSQVVLPPLPPVIVVQMS